MKEESKQIYLYPFIENKTEHLTHYIMKEIDERVLLYRFGYLWVSASSS